VRKKAEGFNYAAVVPYVVEDRPRLQQRGQRHPRGSQNSHRSSAQPRPSQQASGNREGGNEHRSSTRPQGHGRRFSPH
jgi:hypothetical protein